MNWKIVVIGGIVFYAVTFIISMATGPLLHEGALKPTYQAHEDFWRPELNQEPPDMGALMPRWIGSGLVWGLVVAGLFACVRRSFSGPGWKKGMVWGLCLGILNATTMLLWSGLFNLPDLIWMVWAGEGLLNYIAAGTVLGWVAGKVAPEG